MNRGSIAILLVVITLTLISAIVVEINYKSQVSATVVVNRRDGEKAYELARAAVRWSVFRLQLDNLLDKIPVIPNTNYGGIKDDLSEVQWAVPLPYPLTGAALSDNEKSSEDQNGDSSEEEKKAVATAAELGGSFVSAITDESSKINLNDVGSGGPAGNVRWSGAAEVLENLLLSYRFQRFFKGKDHRELLWAIDDWTDGDSEVNHLGGGVENAQYRGDDADIQIKNAPFYTVAEIRMLKPMTEDLYRELLPFVTVYPFDARLPRMNTAPASPVGRINVNTAPMEILAAIVSRQVLSEPRDRLECAQKLVKFRKNVVFRSVEGTEPSFLGALGQICGLQASQGGGLPYSPTVRQILDVHSNTFSVEATGTANQSDKTIRAVVSRQDPAKPRILYWKVL